MQRKICFVCTGNVCRSPMAEYLFRAMVPPSWDVVTSSYGTMTTDGHEASNNASVVSMENGIDLSAHQSRALRPDELRECDLIFTMTRSHRDHIGYLMPDLADRLFCLTEYGRSVRKPEDVKDPMGGDLATYRKCFAQLQDEIKRIIPVMGRQFGFS